MQTILAAVAVAAGLTILYFVTRRRRRFESTYDRVVRIASDERNLRVGPFGTKFWIEPGAELDAAVMNAIETGIQNCFDRAACRGYTRQLRHSDYNVAILVSKEVDSSGYPTYRLPAGPYARTEFDKGGYILVAGEMVAVGNPIGNWMAIPEHPLSQAYHAGTVGDYETEHIVTAWNDGEEFERTKIHGIGTGHPFIPNCPGYEIERLTDAYVAMQSHVASSCIGGQMVTK